MNKRCHQRDMNDHIKILTLIRCANWRIKSYYNYHINCHIKSSYMLTLWSVNYYWMKIRLTCSIYRNRTWSHQRYDHWYDDIIDMKISLALSTHWHDQLIDMINSLTWSTHWHDQIIAIIKSLTWSNHWHDQIIDMIKSLTWSNHWHDHIIDMITSLTW